MTLHPTFKSSQGKPQQLVVLLHGYGANGDDLISLARSWSEYLPNAEFISPNAPHPCDGSPFFGRQWFPIHDLTHESLIQGVRNAAPDLDAFLTQALAKRDLTDNDLILMGFSQGCMMALYMGLTRKKPCAGILGYSGALICTPLEVQSRPPVLLVHGEEDQLVPYHETITACERLQEWRVPVDVCARPYLGHGIDEEGIIAGGTFMGRLFQNKDALRA